MKKHIKIISFSCYLLFSIILIVLFGVGVFDSFELRFEDAIYQSPSAINKNIVVVGLDEKSFNEYGDFNLWSRDKIADLINKLSANPDTKPALIGIDVGFYSYKEEGYTSPIDQKFVASVENAGNVILNCAASSESEVTIDTTFMGMTKKITLVEEPFPELKDACLSFGHCNFGSDRDRVIRNAYGDITFNNNVYHSFAYELYKNFTGKEQDFGKTNYKYYIKYSGLPGDYYACSIVDVLNGEYPIEAFADKIVLIGAYATGTQDNYYTSISTSKQMYGVEIHANVLNQLIEGKKVIKANTLISCIIIFVLLFAVILIYSFINNKLAYFAPLGLDIFYCLIAFIIFKVANIILPLAIPIIGVIVLGVVHIIVNLVYEMQEKKKLIDSYSKYLPRDVAKKIANSSEDIFNLGGVKKDIAVLFVDIRGFTTLSESLDPEEIVDMLNKYLAVTTKAIFDNEGTVDKFIGDATMGLFNAPLDLDNYVYKAVLCGLDMCHNMKSLETELADNLKGRVGFGVGINCGDAVIGNIGTSFRMDYTAIGDTVNTASRLEGIAKAGEVIVSEEVYQRTKDLIEYVDLGKVKLKGKAEEVQIYRAIERIEQ